MLEVISAPGSTRRSPHLRRAVARDLEEAGFDKVYDYEGGTEDWFEQKNAA